MKVNLAIIISMDLEDIYNTTENIIQVGIERALDMDMEYALIKKEMLKQELG